MSKRTAKKYARYLQHGAEKRCELTGGHQWVHDGRGGARCARCNARQDPKP